MVIRSSSSSTVLAICLKILYLHYLYYVLHSKQRHISTIWRRKMPLMDLRPFSATRNNMVSSWCCCCCYYCLKPRIDRYIWTITNRVIEWRPSTAKASAINSPLNKDILCYETRYSFTELEQHRSTEPVRIREYVWCLGFPPRCSKYRTETKEIVKYQVSIFYRVYP